ncbi:hypothetical protein [Nocardioides sp. T2.26MG-1]|uniref:hypothetical protein n=1 Tax=Nocardioides sp. T2.26MG-1 TaxID=3041166 RepID=UPI00253FCD98|nr:hypothetical protein [Nocardioides sp. T2.26MG-1]
MSSHDDEPVGGISDEQLPEDLRPTEDNPLAQPLSGDEAKSPEELDMQGGKTPEESGDRPEDDEDDEDDEADEAESEG